MYELWHEHMELKHGEKQNYVTWTETVLYPIYKQKTFTQKFFKKIKTRFDTSYFESEKSLPKRKYKKTVGPMKNELNGKIMRKFAALRPCSYLTEDKEEDKKAQGFVCHKKKN